MTVKTIKGKQELRIDDLDINALKKAAAYDQNALKVISKDKEVQFEISFEDRNALTCDNTCLNIARDTKENFIYLPVNGDPKLLAVKISRFLPKIEAQATKANKDFEEESAKIVEI